MKKTIWCSQYFKKCDQANIDISGFEGFTPHFCISTNLQVLGKVPLNVVLWSTPICPDVITLAAAVDLSVLFQWSLMILPPLAPLPTPTHRSDHLTYQIKTSTILIYYVWCCVGQLQHKTIYFILYCTRILISLFALYYYYRNVCYLLHAVENASNKWLLVVGKLWLCFAFLTEWCRTAVILIQ